jgi:DNA invertase Pin-like site-specific DNA recombinase
VSRWGRFQDIDAGAFYEYVCRQEGVSVVYCAEPFENDRSAIAGILKSMKRVMAAEYSRELSRKVFAGQCHIARMGFKLGGPAPYGLRRMLVDADGRDLGVLEPGQRKAIANQRVRFVKGPEKEQAAIRIIFTLRTEREMSFPEIARCLNKNGARYIDGGRWNSYRVQGIVRNPAYCGRFIFNKTQQKLGAPAANNPPSDWIVVEDAIPPIITKETFAEAQAFSYPPGSGRLDRMKTIEMLRRLFESKGYLSTELIDSTPALPCASYYGRRFGGLRGAYAEVGFVSGNHPALMGTHDIRRYYREMMLSSLLELFRSRGVPVRKTYGGQLLANEDVTFAIFVAACCSHKSGGSYWRLNLGGRRARSDILVFGRLGPGNQFLQDYLVARERVISWRTKSIRQGEGAPDGCRIFQTLAETPSIVWGSWGLEPEGPPRPPH